MPKLPEEDELRQIVLRAIAIFSEGECGELVLKGGSALESFYDHPRHSQDMDFSLSTLIDDKVLEKCKSRFFKILEEEFSSEGYIIFRERWDPRPPQRDNLESLPFWRGHQIYFDITEYKFYMQHKADKDKTLTDPNNYKRVRIDLSEIEYTEPAVFKELPNGYMLKVYTPVMIVCEKLRAICQNTSEYLKRFGKEPNKSRMRDFYDIYIVNEKYKINWHDKDNLTILKEMFKVKDVDLSLLLLIKTNEVKEIHDLPGEYSKLKDTVRGEVKPFDFYYQYVVNLVQEIWDNISSTFDQTEDLP